MRKKPEKSFNINCVECGKEFSVTPTYFYKKKIRRCSLGCAYKAMKGRKKSEEHKRKIAIARLGKTNYKWTDEQKEARRRKMIGLSPHRNKTIEEKAEIYKKIAISNKKPRPHMRGENCPAWRGGISKTNHLIRNSAEYKNWRQSVFKRDNFTCQECKIRGTYLQADHIKPFAYFPEFRFVADNGRTLCVECHKKTNTYGVKLKNK